MNAALLRNQLEASLSDRFPSPFAYRQPAAPEAISVPVLDPITGGLPRGVLTEICGPESSGRTALLLSIFAHAEGEFCALIDGRDTFDPHSAADAGVELRRLLWVRCGKLDQALRAAELLLSGGGFGIVAVDLIGVPTPLMRRIPLSVWFRFRWSIRGARTALIVLEREPTVGTSASLVLKKAVASGMWQVARKTVASDKQAISF